MTSKAATISEYLEELPHDRRAALSELRALIHRVAPKTVEAMQYGLPAFGEVCALASQKNYMALYVCEGDIVKGIPRTVGQGELWQGLHPLQAAHRPESERRGEHPAGNSEASKAGHRAKLPVTLLERKRWRFVGRSSSFRPSRHREEDK